MNPKKYASLVVLFLISLLLSSCLRERFEDYVNALELQENDSIIDTGAALTELTFPSDFQFNTETTVNVIINDSEDNIVYEVYAQSEEVRVALDSIQGPLPYRLLERRVANGGIREQLTIATFIDSLLLVRKSNTSVQAFTRAVESSGIVFTYSGSANKNRTTKQQLLQKTQSECTNIYGQPLAVDLFDTNTSTTSNSRSISNIHFPNQDVRASIEATSVNGPELKSSFFIGIAGLSTPIFTVNDYAYWMSSRIDTKNSNEGYVEFVMRFDQPVQELLLHVRSVDNSMYQFVGSEHTESLLSGGYEFVYEENTRLLRDENPKSRGRYYRDGYGTILISATSNSFTEIVWRRIDDPNSSNKNDSNWFTFTEVPACNDRDGDGAEDMIDLYPDDPEKAFESYYPSKTTKASIVFEDLWPFLGDYDFNDTAVDYSIKTISNANNEVVGLDFDYEVTADGASFVNGFAFELPGISPNSVLQISGQVLTNSVFELASNGTEMEQTNVVIPLFDDHSALLGQPGKVSVSFSSPIPEGQLGGGPFKPFLVVNGDRETEIHLVGNIPTSLGNSRPSVAGSNVDADGNYATAEGLPWAINITEEFTVLQEKITIDEGYLFFRAWAISGGKNRKDWYKPNLGYRNPNKLQLD